MIKAEVGMVSATFYCEECGHSWDDWVEATALAQENCFQVAAEDEVCPNCEVAGDEEVEEDYEDDDE